MLISVMVVLGVMLGLILTVLARMLQRGIEISCCEAKGTFWKRIFNVAMLHGGDSLAMLYMVLVHVGIGSETVPFSAISLIFGFRAIVQVFKGQWNYPKLGWTKLTNIVVSIGMCYMFLPMSNWHPIFTVLIISLYISSLVTEHRRILVMSISDRRMNRNLEWLMFLVMIIMLVAMQLSTLLITTSDPTSIKCFDSISMPGMTIEVPCPP